MSEAGRFPFKRGSFPAPSAIRYRAAFPLKGGSALPMPGGVSLMQCFLPDPCSARFPPCLADGLRFVFSRRVR